MNPQLLDTLDRQFAAGARIRGDRYLRQGRVHLRRLDEKTIAAEVRGTRRYDVSLKFYEKSGNWEVFCTCEAFVGFGPCKHLWATIQAAKVAWKTHVAPRVAPGTGTGSRSSQPGASHAFGSTLDITERILAELRPRADLEDAEEEAEWNEDGEDPDARGPDRMARPGARYPEDHPFDELRALATRSSARAEKAAPPERRLGYVLEFDRESDERRPRIRLTWQRAYKRGGWSEPKPFVVRDRDEVLDLSAEDRAIVALLRGASGDGRWTFGNASTFELPIGLPHSVLPRMIATGRLHLAVEGVVRAEPVAWDGGGSFEFGIALSRKKAGDDLAIEGFLARGDERLPLATSIAILQDGLVVTENRVAEVDWRGAWECASILQRSGRMDVAKESVGEALSLVLLLPGEPHVDAPDLVREIVVVPVPRLLLGAPEPAEAGRPFAEAITGRVEFEYGAQRLRSRDDGRLRLDGDGLVRVRRDGTAEQAALERLSELGARTGTDPATESDVAIQTCDLPALVTALTAEGWTVEAAGRPCRSDGSLRLSIRSGIDWFDLAGGAEFGDVRATLPDLLRAIEAGSRWVRLSDGSFGVLPEAWLAGWGLAGVASEGGERLRFHRSQAWILDLLLAERGEVDADAAFNRARGALRRFERFEPAHEPQGFRGELRGYQREGLGWLRLLRELGLGGCLADDMGLGKTVQVLAMLAEGVSGERKTSIVVAPRSVVFNWLREAERFAPDLSVLAHHGPGRTRKAKELAQHDLVVTTYGTLRRDVELLSKIPFAHAILDEAQMIKNASSQAAKAARLLRADHRLALTGTPVENHLDDLWSIFEFLNPGMLGRSKVFRELVAPEPGPELPVASEAGASAADASAGKPAIAAIPANPPTRALAQALRPFLLRRTKEQVLQDLPPKIEQVIACELEGPELRRYEELRDHYRATLLSRVDEQGIERSRMHVLEALLRLRQAACHPGLIDRSRSGEGSAKLDALLPMLEEVRESGHKALVFSQFTSFLAIVRARLDLAGATYEYLDGRTRKREEKVRRFQEDAGCPLFLISLKAGGFGLNLAAADYVFLLDPWWNPAVERQAIDRTHRIGQTQTVNAYRLVAQGTIEEKVIELQERKRELADAILGETEGTLRDLTREDLERLLS